ncbi:MAG TPA: hypothetical protein VNN73_18010 [Blastocatellia bacterium]|nr:hypothetical protein [Blastocatellia bacterium]
MIFSARKKGRRGLGEMAWTSFCGDRRPEPVFHRANAVRDGDDRVAVSRGERRNRCPFSGRQAAWASGRRGASSKLGCVSQRRRQLRTVWRLQPTRRAISALLRPSWASRENASALDMSKG